MLVFTGSIVRLATSPPPGPFVVHRLMPATATPDNPREGRRSIDSVRTMAPRVQRPFSRLRRGRKLEQISGIGLPVQGGWGTVAAQAGYHPDRARAARSAQQESKYHAGLTYRTRSFVTERGCWIYPGAGPTQRSSLRSAARNRPTFARPEGKRSQTPSPNSFGILVAGAGLCAGEAGAVLPAVPGRPS